MHKCSDGKSRVLVSTLAAFVGDIMEANLVFGILHHASPRSDISSLVTVARLNDPDHEPDPRTETHMREVCNAAHSIACMDTTSQTVCTTLLRFLKYASKNDERALSPLSAAILLLIFSELL